MAAGRVDFIVDQGEDWTAQLVWSDYYDNPMAVVPPMRMAIKSPYGQIVKELYPPDVPPAPDEIPPITYNTDAGIIQLHMNDTETSALQPGTYGYDLFVNLDDNEAYAGTQQVRLIFGNVYVNGRTTVNV